MLSLPADRNMCALLPALAVSTLNRSWTRVSVVDLLITSCMDAVRIFFLLILRNHWERRWVQWKKPVATFWPLPDWNHLITETVSAILMNRDVCRDSGLIGWMETNFILRKCPASSPVPSSIAISIRSLNAYFPASRPNGRLPLTYCLQTTTSVSLWHWRMRTITALRSLCLVRKSRLGLHRLITWRRSLLNWETRLSKRKRSKSPSRRIGSYRFLFWRISVVRR